MLGGTPGGNLASEAEAAATKALQEATAKSEALAAELASAREQAAALSRQAAEGRDIACLPGALPLMPPVAEAMQLRAHLGVRCLRSRCHCPPYLLFMCVRAELRQQLAAASSQVAELQASQEAAATAIETARQREVYLQECLQRGDAEMAHLRAELEARPGGCRPLGSFPPSPAHSALGQASASLTCYCWAPARLGAWTAPEALEAELQRRVGEAQQESSAALEATQAELAAAQKILAQRAGAAREGRHPTTAVYDTNGHLTSRTSLSFHSHPSTSTLLAPPPSPPPPPFRGSKHHFLDRPWPCPNGAPGTRLFALSVCVLNVASAHFSLLAAAGGCHAESEAAAQQALKAETARREELVSQLQEQAAQLQAQAESGSGAEGAHHSLLFGAAALPQR